jgi:hypothetical protein
MVQHPDFAAKKLGPSAIPGSQNVRLDSPAILEGTVRPLARAS